MPTATNNHLPRGFLLSNKPIVLWIHDPGAIYNHDAVVNPEMFPNFCDGQLLRILCPRNSQPQQSQNSNNKSEQQDGKKQHDSNNLQGQQQQGQNIQGQQQQQAEQANAQGQQLQMGDKQDHLEQLDFVIVKGHAADKENLAKQQQLQVN